MKKNERKMNFNEAARKKGLGIFGSQGIVSTQNLPEIISKFSPAKKKTRPFCAIPSSILHSDFGKENTI